jgi:hypothetical protein
MSTQVDLIGDGFVTGLRAVKAPVYADAAARDARPVLPVEGKLVWLSDPGVLSVYNGSDWVDV